MLLACIAAIAWCVLNPVSPRPAAAVRSSGTSGLSSATPESAVAVRPVTPASTRSEGAHKAPIFPASAGAPARIDAPLFSSQPGSKSPHTPPFHSEKIPRPAQSQNAGCFTPHSVREAEEHPVPNLPYPAVWVDLDTTPPLSADQQAEIQHAAEELVAKIKNSGLEPGSPEYRDLWLAAVADSDQLFKQRYGARLWLQHHAQAHHLETQPATR